MKVIVPNYYNQFKCIADRCRHNCCIGWEIDIDEDTYALYRSQSGPLANRLKNCISPIDTPHFILDEQERCPFLSDNGLCDIITYLGEDHLCDICADHPRFRNAFSSHTEMGLGLCCEAAAALILGQKEKVSFEVLDRSALPEEEQIFFAARDNIFSLLQDRSCSIEERINKLSPEGLPRLDWKESFLGLERLDPTWDKKLNHLDITLSIPRERDLISEQLAVYFVYRHLAGALEDGRFTERLRFCLLSVKVINSIAKTDEELPEIARLYSAEIEYSDENIDILLDRLS